MNHQDAALLWQIDQDADVMRFVNEGKPSSRETIDNVMIPRMLSYRNPVKGWGIWKICIAETNQFIGWVLVRPKDFFTDKPDWHNLELGWRFHRFSWGKGFATEAAQHLAGILSEQKDVSALSAIALPENAASIAVMKKLGMVYIKTGLHRDPLGDHEVVYYQRQIR